MPILNNAYLGATKINKAYLGSILVFDATPTTFRVVQSFGEPDNANTVATAAPSVGLTEGSYLVVISAERSGHGESGHSVSDDNSGTWTKRGGLDSVNSDLDNRFSMTVWSRPVTFSDDGTTPTVTVDSGVDSAAFMAVEVQAATSFGWQFEGAALTTSGTDAWHTATPPSLSLTGDDNLLLAVGATRPRSPNPVSSEFLFADQPDDKAFLVDSDTFKVAFIAAIESEGQPSGSYGADLQTTGSYDQPGIVALLAWSDGAG